MEFYTYAHSTPSGEVFYIGKGVKNRVYSTNDRSYLWHEMRNSGGGILMKIIKRFETEDEAFEHEQSLIAMHKDMGSPLVNLSAGGKGSRGCMHSDASNEKRRKKMTGYRYELVTCPHCGFVGGVTSTKRFHFDNCIGLRPKFKARVSANGERLYLGKFQTKAAAEEVVLRWYHEHGMAVPSAFYRKGTGRTKPVGQLFKE
jgi:hypothetical protein